MGYRLEMSKVKYSSCGGKLFGYTENDKELKSYQWLVKNGYIDEDEYFDYGNNPKILLGANEFKEFINLYNEDWNEVWRDNQNWVINNPEIQELLKWEDNVLLEWW